MPVDFVFFLVSNFLLEIFLVHSRFYLKWLTTRSVDDFWKDTFLLSFSNLMFCRFENQKPRELYSKEGYHIKLQERKQFFIWSCPIKDNWKFKGNTKCERDIMIHSFVFKFLFKWHLIYQPSIYKHGKSM